MSYGRTLQLTPDGDLLKNPLNRFEEITGTAKVAQDLTVILRTVKGSYPFNTAFGVDWVAITHSGYNRTLINAEIRTALLSHPAVKQVDSLEISRDTPARHATITATVTLYDGDTVTLEADV